MAKQQAAEQQETLGQAMNRTELFLENNGRKMSYVLLALLVVGLLIYGYRALIISREPRKPPR